MSINGKNNNFLKHAFLSWKWCIISLYMYLLIRKESSAVSISLRFVTSNLYILRSKYKKKWWNHQKKRNFLLKNATETLCFLHEEAQEIIYIIGYIRNKPTYCINFWDKPTCSITIRLTVYPSVTNRNKPTCINHFQSRTLHQKLQCSILTKAIECLCCKLRRTYQSIWMAII